MSVPRRRRTRQRELRASPGRCARRGEPLSRTAASGSIQRVAVDAGRDSRLRPSVGLVPAAGHARRLSPLLSGSKEVCPIGGRPVIDYLLERMHVAKCGEIRVVTRPDKQDVVDHARARGARVILGEPKSVSESLLAGIEGLDADTAVVFGFPDTLWEPRDGFGALLAALGPGVAAVLGIFRAEEPERSDVVRMEGDCVIAVDVKPKRPPSDLIWGCAATWVRTLQGLHGCAEPGHLFGELARRGLIRGVRLRDPFVDIGTPEALQRARDRALSGGAEA
jgi:NDP-sugar pyrophosphorylase family protein